LGRCVRALAAADFAALLDFGSAKTFPALLAAARLVTSDGAVREARWVRALAAADFAALLDLGLLSVLPALLAAAFPVTSLRGIFASWRSKIDTPLKGRMANHTPDMVPVKASKPHILCPFRVKD
jgi:hypothetical protein